MEKKTSKLLVKWFSALIISLFFTSNAHAFADKIDEILSEQSPHKFHGVAVLADGENIIYEKSTVEGINSNTSFKVGSLSKQVTAALAMQLVETNRLNLNEPISKYLPDLKDNWKYFVSTHHLLSHTSGIKNFNRPLLFQPGIEFKYSNINYEIVGMIIESIVGSKFGNLADGLFESARLSNSFSPSHSRLRDIVPGYVQENNGKIRILNAKDQRPGEPSGGLVSSASDLVRWNQLLHKKKLILHAQAYESFTKKHQTRKHRYGDLAYGYGIQISNTKNGTEYSHSGYIDGYISTLLYYPERDLSVVILENISWKLGEDNDAKDAFYFHDKIRNLIAKDTLTE
jgi:CubicO group peptidase (beta-lactamase class C family)